MARAPGVNKMDREFLKIAGTGVVGSTDVIVAGTNTYTAGSGEYVYAIEMYTDQAKFTELKEGGSDVASRRLDPGGDGYPLGTVITGRFTNITAATGTRVGIWIIK